MIIGRNKELEALTELYNSNESSISICYGRSGIGKTTLLREFTKDKGSITYTSVPSSKNGQIELMNSVFTMQDKAADYDEIFSNIVIPNNKGVNVVIIENFQIIVKSNPDFFDSLVRLASGSLSQNKEKYMIILTSSSVSWVENSLVGALGRNALNIKAFIKLKELNFVDVVRVFPKLNVRDAMLVYAVTGGVPGYMSYFDENISVKDNICRLIVDKRGPLHNAGNDYVGEELRETGLYNTILWYLACGENKLNELHAHTGFGRDKISVYLKNLNEREVIEKIFSWDLSGNEHSRKGLYGIKHGLLLFWYRFIYGNYSLIENMPAEDFYNTYIEGQLNDYLNETYIKIGTEFIELMDTMGRLPIHISRRGRFYGKNGDVHIVACDEEGRYVAGQCVYSEKTFTYEMYEDMLANMKMAAIKEDNIYLFANAGFDERLRELDKENPAITLISADEL